MYQIQCKKLDNPFQPMIHHDWHGAPTYNQKRMMDAVEKALLQGIFYNREMDEFVKNELADILTPEIFDDLKNGTNRTEGGAFGTDVYNCRKVVEERLKLLANKEALEKLMASGLISIGTKLKNISYGAKKYSTCTVVEIQAKTGEILVHGKRRGSSSQWAFTLQANETRLLTSILEGIKDNSITVSSNNGIRTYVIDPTGNRQQEFTCQI